MGYEGGVRTIGFVADLSSDHRYLPAGTKYEGLMHIAGNFKYLIFIQETKYFY
jgi:hypothetical protein